MCVSPLTILCGRWFVDVSDWREMGTRVGWFGKDGETMGLKILRGRDKRIQDMKFEKEAKKEAKNVKGLAM